MTRAAAKKPHLRLVRTARPTARAQRDVRAQQRDEQVEQAIALMRGALAERWTVTRLAKRVGLSRPAFARRFVASTGESPRRYLARVRMERAAELLRSSREGLARIGAQVGYDSEFAFNRAFKRAYLVAPGTFRRLAAAGLTTRHATETPTLTALRAAA